MEYEVVVETRAEVLDPQGRAIQKALVQTGFANLVQVRVGKRYVLTFAAQKSSGEELEKPLADQVAAIAQQHLANPVAETFFVKRLS